MKTKYKQARKEMEEAKTDYYLCHTESCFEDDVKLKCFKCKKQVYARPYYPRNAKIVCIECKEENKLQLRELNIKKDRKEIARIIRTNLPLMNKNKMMCQEIADCILAYLIGAI